MKLILVVDDDVSVREIISLTLQEFGFEVGTASNGHEAELTFANRMPDLVISDQKMPVMGGPEFIRRVKQSFPTLPIILIGGQALDELAATAAECGADCFLPKPLDSTSFLRKVRQYLGGCGPN